MGVGVRCARQSLAARRVVRPAVSLLEVLISVGVVGIGLLGVASLIPIAHHEAAQGVRDDRQAAVGKRAFREFRIRGFDVPNSLSRPDQFYWITTNPARADHIYVNDPTNPAAAKRLRRQSYCFDPLLVAYTGSFAFPHDARGINLVPIPRVTLLAQRGPYLGTSSELMGIAQAETIFRTHDDLVLEQPADRQSLPVARYLIGNNQMVEKRYANGRFSWMATLVPDLSITSTQQQDAYVLSIVVFEDRVLTVAPRQELIAEARLIGSEQGAMKEVAIRPVQPPASAEDVGVWDIQPESWLLLWRRPAPDQPARLRWYQVAAAESQADNDDTWRELSLIGPDLPEDWRGNVPWTGFAVFVRGVTAVYEKTIRLYASDHWGVY